MLHLRRRVLGALQSQPGELRAAFQLLQILNLSTKRQANEIRIGNILDVDGRLMQVLKYAHAQTGRQIGNVQLELRDVLTKSKHPLKLRPSEMVEVVRLDEKKFQYLYQEDESLHCMDPETFEQVAISRDIFGTSAGFLAEGGDVILSFHDGTPVAGALPPQVTLKIAEAAPHLKGEAQAPQYKPAVLETGATISVPPFVVAGDTVIVDTVNGTFVKRA